MGRTEEPSRACRTSWPGLPSGSCEEIVGKTQPELNVIRSGVFLGLWGHSWLRPLCSEWFKTSVTLLEMPPGQPSSQEVALAATTHTPPMSHVAGGKADPNPLATRPRTGSPHSSGAWTPENSDRQTWFGAQPTALSLCLHTALSLCPRVTFPQPVGWEEGILLCPVRTSVLPCDLI